MAPSVSTDGVHVIAPVASVEDAPGREVRREPLVPHPAPVTAAAVVLGVLAVVSYSSLADRLIAGFMTVVLVVVTATDLERRVIPNRVVFPASAVVLILRFAFFPGRSVEFLLAALGAGLFLLLPNLINGAAMGMGDVKLGVFLGAGLGWGVIGALLAGLLAILPFAVGALIRGGGSARTAALPFAPFLAFGTIVVLTLPRLVG